MTSNFFVVMRLTEQVSRPLRRVASSANLLTDAADRMSTQVQAANAVMVGFAAGATAAVGALSSSAAQLENSLARLETVTRSTSGSVDTALGNAEKSARDFSLQYTATASEFIDAQFQIATAGVAVEEQVAATAGAFKLARATVGEFTQSAQLLGSFLNTFGKSAEFNYLRPAEKVQAITDRLTTAVQRFQVTLPVLAESFKFIVGPASTLNLNLGEVTAALGVLNTAGFRGTLAGTALSNVFNKLDRAVEKLDLNPDKFIDLNGELKDLTSFFEELNRALGDSTPIEKQNKLISTFDIRAGRVIKTLLDNIDALKQFRGELDISSGATEKLANIVENTTSSQFKKFLNQLQNIATTIGGAINEVLRPFAKSLAEAAKVVAGFVERNKTLIASLVAGLAAVTTLFVAYTTLRFIFLTVTGSLLRLVTQSGLTRAALVALRVAALATGKVFKGLGFALELATMAFKNFTAASLVARVGLARLFGVGRGLVSLLGGGLVGGLQGLIGVLGVFGGALTGAVIAGAAVGVAVRLITSALDDTADASKRASLSLEELDANFGNSIERASSFAAELTRIAKTIRDDIDIPLRGGEQLGKLPFAQAATQAIKNDPTVSRKDALLDAAKAAGGFDGLVRQLSNAIDEGSLANIAYANSLRKIKEQTDSTFGALDDVQKFDAVTKSLFLGGGGVALEALSGGNTQAAEALAALISDYEKLGEEINNTEVRAQVTNRSFERIIANLDELRDSGVPAVQELVKAIDQASNASDALRQTRAKEISSEESIPFADALAKAQEEIPDFITRTKDGFKAFNAQSTAFFKILNDGDGVLANIARRFIQLRNPGAVLLETVNGIKTAISQTSSATKSVVNLYKNAALGGESFAKAADVSAERILQAEENLQRVIVAIGLAENELKKLADNPLANTKAFKEAQEFVDSLQDTEIQLRARINEAEALRNANRVFALIARQSGKALEAQQVEDIKSLAGAFQNAIGDALTGATTGNIFGSLTDQFKKQFVGEIQKDISLLFGNQFKDQFRSAINSARGVIEQAQLNNTLFTGLQDGTLQDQINAAIQAAVPGIQAITGDDIFNLSEGNKLAEQFKDGFTDASVAIVTAGNRSAAILEQLQGVLSQGPGQDQNALRQQATEIRNLLQQASSTGATDAVRPLENALGNVLQALQQSGPPAAVEQIATATQQSTAAIESSSGRFAGVIQTLVPAAGRFIETIEQGFRRIQQTDFGQLAGDLISGLDPSAGRSVEVQVDSNGTLNVNVDATSSGGVTSNGTGFLEEDEIREIINETRDGLLLEVEERLRVLENELRNR